MGRKYLVLLVAVLMLSVVAVASAETQFPTPRGPVNDFVGVLSPADLTALESICLEVEQRTGAALVVAIVKTHAPESLEDYATKLFAKWGIGQKGKDNGVLILLAMDERALKIEVGYGLEDVLTDARAGQIRDLMVPEFGRGAFADGLRRGLQATAAVVASKYGVTLEQTGGFRVRDLDPRPSTTALALLVVVVILALLIVSMRAATRPRCPRCRRRLVVTDRVLQAATIQAGGLAVRVYRCTGCGYTREQQYRTNRLAPASGGPVITGGGPFWGGTRGSGRSSPGRSFGGFGGGRSGGGGARGKW
jgi:uncharacterized protein